MQRERRTVPWARAGVVALAVSQGLLAVFVAAFLRWGWDVFHTLAREAKDHAGNVGPPPIPWMFPFFYLLEAVLLGALVAVMVWLFRAATHARNLGIPARRAPFWAVVGFIVPVVNFWFPYQVAADCLAPSDAAGRRTILRWWLLYILGTVVLEVLGGVCAFAPVSVAVPVAVAGGLAWIGFEARSGLAMIAGIADTHERATSAYGR